MKKLVAIVLALFSAGCTSQSFYHSIDGTSTLLGVSLPYQEYIQINALSYLGGSKTTVRDKAVVQHEYECWSTNSYFGVVHTHEYRKSKITVCPTNIAIRVSKTSD